MKASEELFKRIGSGRIHILTRPSDRYIDRELRRIINTANKNGDCIINSGDGYYRPRPGVEKEESELREYLWSELGRGRDILYKRLKMQETFEKWREYGILCDGPRETGQS